MDINQRLDRLDLVLLEQDSKEFRHAVAKKVIGRIRAGGSVLKKSLDSGGITIADVVRAIKNKRCLRTPDQDLGNTYLEQIVGTAIRETIPTQHINAAREMFGLSKLSPSDLTHQSRRAEI